MKHPAFVLPGALPALPALHASIEKSGVPQRTLELVTLRVGQINGCSVRVDGHWRIAKRAGEDERLFAVAAWRDAPYFTAGERAGLVLAIASTNVWNRLNVATRQPAGAWTP
jgi:AhpD family alkylhydroperoxidase